MPPVIECCVRNLADDRRERLRDGDCTLRVRPCLEHCGICRKTPFEAVDGDLLVGDERTQRLADPDGDGE